MVTSGVLGEVGQAIIRGETVNIYTKNPSLAATPGTSVSPWQSLPTETD